MLISQITPFMFIVAKTEGAQHGLKDWCVLEPTDLKKVQTDLQRLFIEEYLISLALKRWLPDKKQQICPAFVNRALQKQLKLIHFTRTLLIMTGKM